MKHIFTIGLLALVLFSCKEEEFELETVAVETKVYWYSITDVTECDQTKRRDSLYNGGLANQELFFFKFEGDENLENFVGSFTTDAQGELDIELVPGLYKVQSEKEHSFLPFLSLANAENYISINSETDSILMSFHSMDCCDSLQPCPIY